MKYFLVLFSLISSMQVIAQDIKTTETDPKIEQEIDSISEICEALEQVYLAKKEIKLEKKIAKQSGASNLANLNDAGRKAVRNTDEAKSLSKKYKTTYKNDPDLSRCVFLENVNETEMKELFKK